MNYHSDGQISSLNKRGIAGHGATQFLDQAAKSRKKVKPLDSTFDSRGSQGTIKLLNNSLNTRMSLNRNTLVVDRKDMERLLEVTGEEPQTRDKGKQTKTRDGATGINKDLGMIVQGSVKQAGVQAQTDETLHENVSHSSYREMLKLVNNNIDASTVKSSVHNDDVDGAADIENSALK